MFVNAVILTIKNKGLIIKYMESGQENFKHSSRICLSDSMVFSSESHGFYDFVSLVAMMMPDT